MLAVDVFVYFCIGFAYLDALFYFTEADRALSSEADFSSDLPEI